MESISFSGAIPEGKHIMLSYNRNSHFIVSKIHQILQDEHIPVWFDGQGDMKHNMYDSLADGVENAAAVCCFITPDYEKSENCQLELQYAHKRQRQIIPCMLNDTQPWKSSVWLRPILIELEYINFHDMSESNIHLTARELIARIKEELSAPLYLSSKTDDKPSYLFELIRRECQRNSRIERIMNPAKSSPIDQSYINLAIIETREQQEKEKKLLNAKHSDNDIISTSGEIYGTGTKIEIKNIFEKCTEQTKNILVLGRAGIGKTTFCRYVAYQWATGAIWQQYQLVIFIRLRSLTESRYPPLASGTTYSLLDLVKKEYFHHGLSEKDERLLKEQFDTSQILWLLDGYDEIVQNTPAHLQYLLEQLLKTPHHILTSRPYLNTLSYNVQLEITGFTDDNIKEYVKQFFEQIINAIDNSSFQAEKLLGFLTCNPRIWGTVHIPVNLELMCSLWCDTDWTETTTLTMTTVYDKMTEWLCRRHLEKQNTAILQIRKNAVYKRCDKELTFLETLAFHGMQENTVILRPKLLEKTESETGYSLDDDSQLLNIGILKSFDDRPIGTRIEAEKNHYFIHLSFQEHFAARYLVKALNGDADQKKKAINFIKKHKYNQRFELVLSFASGLLNDREDHDCINLFWETLLGEPLDLIGLRHVELLIACIEETECNKNLPRFRQSLNSIIKCIKYSVSNQHHYLYKRVKTSLERSPSLVNQPEILDTFRMLHKNEVPWIKETAYCMICYLPISSLKFDLIGLHLAALNDENGRVQQIAYQALGRMSKQAATDEVINTLITAFGDADPYIRHNACHVLRNIGEKATTDNVIKRLVSELQHPNYYTRETACEALGDLGEKAATIEAIDGLAKALRDKYDSVRRSACRALSNIGAKAATIEVISGLLDALRDTDALVKWKACEALGKMGEQGATDLVISRLLNTLEDTNPYIRLNARQALQTLIEKAATNDVINAVVTALNDMDPEVRLTAPEILQKLAENKSTSELIYTFESILRDSHTSGRWYPGETQWKPGQKRTTTQLTNELGSTLEDTNSDARREAFEADGNFGAKVLTSEVTNGLITTLADTSFALRSEEREVFENILPVSVIDEVILELLSTFGETNSDVRRVACQTLQNFGENAATSEVINGLLNALRNTNSDVRRVACQTLKNFDENAATSEVINGLVSALGDTDSHVRSNACEALGNFGEKASTNEVTNGLLSALGDRDFNVRRSACEALGNFGEKAATHEVISGLAVALEDTDSDVRRQVWIALSQFGEKAGTNEVIQKLVSAIRDTDSDVRGNACEALGNFGRKAATNEVVSGLVNALENTNSDVRRNACKALGIIGKTAATNEVINGLMSALRDTDSDVRGNACEAFRSMGEKAATNEVISGLVSALGDTNSDVRINACGALGSMGEKIATNEVINGLVNALEDTNSYVRGNACAALRSMGEKAATNEVINGLMSALRDTDSDVRGNACEALGSMGEKAATNKVINGLVSALGDTYSYVRENACVALRSMGEKAAANEVILGLAIALEDTDSGVRTKACGALKSIGEKAGSIEVIRELLRKVSADNIAIRDVAIRTIEHILSVVPCISHFDDLTVKELSLCINRFSQSFQDKISPKKLVKAFLDTKILFWLPIIKEVLVRNGYPMTITEDTVTLYVSNESVQLPFADRELGQQLKDALVNWMDESS